MTTINLTINGKPLSADAEPRTHLADFLRESHNLTGTHIGCEHGVCGACTVLVDGAPARSCITFAIACDHAEVTTIEGLDDDEIAIELRAAFKKEHALQCGYCTPGMMVSARDVVLRLESPSEHDIRVAMSGNLCRCTGYVGIIRAVEGVVRARRERGVRAIPDGNRKLLGPVGSGRARAIAAPSGERPRIAGAAAGPAGVATRASHGNANWTPQTRFERSFTVAHPVDQVWAFFGRVGDVARCLPGASIDGEPVGGHVDGRMKVKVGPISAEFEGAADITRDDATRTGTISGAGKDRRGNSATRGLVGYSVKQGEGPNQTRVDVTIGFTLTGALAQFSRSGLVEDIANRLISAFVGNLEARLSDGEGPTPAAAEFDAGSLFFSVIADRIKAFFNRLFGRG